MKAPDARFSPIARLAMCGLVAMVLLGMSYGLQHSLNRDRAAMGLTRITPLENAPPVLAFTTVALGGFRGLIANALWIRANDLQLEGKYFEMVQLADWITKLEPRFTQVWVVQAWNMAYNISVKFTDYGDRWRWVQRGIELLRDEGLHYNPNEALMYRELAWFFQHKMGQNLDDGHNYYKAAWAKEMTDLLGATKINYAEWLDPQTEQARQRLQVLRQKYKMDIRRMKEVDDLYGPLEWRLPEAHAIYWAYTGLKESKNKDLITLRRVIYQSMHIAVLRGRISYVQPNGRVITGPALDKLERASAAYEQMIRDDTEMRDVIQRAHRNFLREAVWLLYSYNRMKEAEYWLNETRKKYPDSIPANMSLEEYAFGRIADDLTMMSQDQTRLLVDSMLEQFYFSLALDEDDRADVLERMAFKVWSYYNERGKHRADALQMPPFNEMKLNVRGRLLDPNSGLLPDIATRLRRKLQLPEPTATPAPPKS